MVGTNRARTIFRGPSGLIMIETDDGLFNIEAPAFGDYSVGDNVSVIVAQQAAWAVPCG